MNKKAEYFAFGITFIAVLASFMVMFAPVRVAAPPAWFGDFDDIHPIETDCSNIDGVCTVGSCQTGDVEISGPKGFNNLGCNSAKCCKDVDTCDGFGLPELVPCFWAGDCKKGFTCKILTLDLKTRCCAEWMVKICHKPGTPGQKTMEVTQSALSSHVGPGGHGDFEGECCVNLGLVECIKVNGITKEPGCAEFTGAPPGSVCARTHGSTGATCCIPPSLPPTPTPTEEPTETEVPTETPTPEETETPVPTDTAEPTPTEEPTETEVPTEVPTEAPVPTSTEVPTSTPVPTGTIF